MGMISLYNLLAERIFALYANRWYCSFQFLSVKIFIWIYVGLHGPLLHTTWPRTMREHEEWRKIWEDCIKGCQDGNNCYIEHITSDEHNCSSWQPLIQLISRCLLRYDRSESARPQTIITIYLLQLIVVLIAFRMGQNGMTKYLYCSPGLTTIILFTGAYRSANVCGRTLLLCGDRSCGEYVVYISQLVQSHFPHVYTNKNWCSAPSSTW